jgi:hypothetical protein
MPVGMFGQLTLDLFSEMDKLGDTIEMTDFMERWTLDAIGKAGFGKWATLQLRTTYSFFFFYRL